MKAAEFELKERDITGVTKINKIIASEVSWLWGFADLFLLSVLKDANCSCPPTPPAWPPSPCFDRYFERLISQGVWLLFCPCFVLPLVIFHSSNTCPCGDAWDYPNHQATSCPWRITTWTLESNDCCPWSGERWEFPIWLRLDFTCTDKKTFFERH